MRESLERHKKVNETIPKVLALFYGLLSVFAASKGISDVTKINPEALLPPPILFFLASTPAATIQIILNLAPLILLLTALKPTSFIMRLCSFVFFFLLAGYHSSFGNLAGTGIIPSIWASFIGLFFIFPSSSRKYRHFNFICLHVFFGALLMPYFISGLWKLCWGGIYQLFFDDISIWSPQAMSYTVAFYTEATDNVTWLGEFIVHNVWLSWPLFILATLLELAAILPIWLPRLWKFIIFDLLLFHLISIWTLDIYFYYQYVLLTALLVLNPLAKPSGSLKDNWNDFLHLQRRIQRCFFQIKGNQKISARGKWQQGRECK